MRSQPRYADTATATARHKAQVTGPMPVLRRVGRATAATTESVLLFPQVLSLLMMQCQVTMERLYNEISDHDRLLRIFQN